MRLQKLYWFGLLAIGLVCVAVLFSLPPNEPILKGHRLSYWLDRSPYCIEESSPEFRGILPFLDDRCIPALIDELNLKPPPMRNFLEKLNRKWFHSRFPIRESRDRRAEAAVVLGWIGSHATNAIPALEKMSHSKSGDYYSAESQRGAAIAALILIRGDSMALCARKALDVHDPECNECRSAIVCLGANATPIVPILVDALQTSTNYWVKDYAASSLRFIHSRPDLSLPPLISMLRNTNSEMRSLAAFALEGFQDAAKPAWNDLVPLLNDPDETVRDNITNALHAIDSSAAKQLGVGPSKFE